MLFVLVLALCLLLLPLSVWPLAALTIAYGACDLFFSMQGACRQSRARALALLTLPFLFPAVHIVYGAATLAGLLTPGAREATPHA